MAKLRAASVLQVPEAFEAWFRKENLKRAVREGNPDNQEDESVRFEVLTEEDIARIDRATMEILRRTGVAVYEKESRDESLPDRCAQS